MNVSCHSWCLGCYAYSPVPHLDVQLNHSTVYQVVLETLTAHRFITTDTHLSRTCKNRQSIRPKEEGLNEEITLRIEDEEGRTENNEE